MACPEGSEKTILLNPVGLSDKTKFVKEPHPGVIVLPENEKPRTVEPDTLTVKPESTASPADELVAVAPSIVNWKPLIIFWVFDVL